MKQTRECSGCHQVLAATTENFRPGKGYHLGLRSKCRECERANRKANRDKERARWNRWAEANRDHVRAYTARKWRENGDRYRQVHDKWYAENRDAILRRRRADWAANRSVYAQKKREYHLLKAPRKMVNGGDLTAAQWRSILVKFDHACAYCGSAEALEQDHIIPITKGGPHSAGNVVPSCRRCNPSKGNREFIRWYRKREFYDPSRERLVLSHITGGHNGREEDICERGRTQSRPSQRRGCQPTRRIQSQRSAQSGRYVR